jgi:putative adenylate-forming enzyme
MIVYIAGAWDAIGMKWRFAHAAPQSLARYRLRRLRSLCTKLVGLSPFFREYFAGVDTRRMSLEQFDGLPLLDKGIMMDRFDEWNTAGLSREELLAFGRENDRTRSYSAWFQGRFSVGLSSGTSGTSGLALFSRAEVVRNTLRFLARTGLPRGLSSHRILFALRTSSAGFGEVNRFGWFLKHVDYRLPLPQVIELINTLRLNILAGSPTYLGQLAEMASGIDHPIDVVVSYAEILEQPVRAALEKAFGTRVHQIYAGTEGYIAASCPHGTLHLNEDLLHIRLVPREGDTAARCHLIVSDINRLTQPILNYRLNDMVELDKAPCACGSCFRAVRGVLGRADDALFFMRSDGTRSLLYADYVCRTIMSVGGAVKEYCVIQHSAADVEVRLDIPAGVEREKTAEAVRAGLAQLFLGYSDQPVRIRVEFQQMRPDPEQKLKRVQRDFEAGTA